MGGRSKRSNAGFTMVEMMVAAASLLLVIGGAMALMKSSRGALEVGGNRSGLQELGRRMLNDVVGEIRGAGITEVAGQSYPAIYDRPIALQADSLRGDELAVMDPTDAEITDSVAWTDPASDPNILEVDRVERNRNREPSEFVFQVPQDLNADDRPIDAEGNMEWGTELVSFHIVQDPNGINWLHRVVEDGGVEVSRERIGPHVQNITFDVIGNDRSMRFNEVGVVIYLQRLNNQGQVITAELESSVVMRNTREL